MARNNTLPPFISALLNRPRVDNKKQRPIAVPGFPGLNILEYRGSNDPAWLLSVKKSRKHFSRVLGRFSTMDFSEAVVAYNKARADIAAGRDPNAGRMKVRDFLRNVYLEWAKREKRSWKSDVSRFPYIELAIGDHRMDGVMPSHILDLQGGMSTGVIASRKQKPLDTKTINKTVSLTCVVFDHAVRQGVVGTNPAAHIRKLPENVSPPVAMTMSDVERLYQTLETEHPLRTGLVLLQLVTGVRVGEALALRHDDIDFENGVIHLRMTKAGVPQEVPLSGVARAVIEAVLVHRVEGNPHLFPALRGSRNGPMAKPYRWLKTVFERAGLTEGAFHRCRKGFATLAMQVPGMDVLTVSRLLRHRSIRTTEIFYLATPQAHLHEAAAQVGRHLSGAMFGVSTGADAVAPR